MKSFGVSLGPEKEGRVFYNPNTLIFLSEGIIKNHPHRRKRWKDRGKREPARIKIIVIRNF